MGFSMPGGVQGLLQVLHSGVTPGSAQRGDICSAGHQTRSAMYKVSALLPVLSLRPRFYNSGLGNRFLCEFSVFISQPKKIRVWQSNSTAGSTPALHRAATLSFSLPETISEHRLSL